MTVQCRQPVCVRLVTHTLIIVKASCISETVGTLVVHVSSPGLADLSKALLAAVRTACDPNGQARQKSRASVAHHLQKSISMTQVRKQKHA